METALIILMAIQGFGMDTHQVAVYESPGQCAEALGGMRLSGDSHRGHHRGGTQVVAYCAPLDGVDGDEPVSLMDKLRATRQVSSP